MLPKMYTFLFTLFLIFIGSEGVSAASTGTFWHITDIHVDQNYSRYGDSQNFCHEDAAKPAGDLGLYGNFLCDSPEILVNVTLNSMKKIQANPDFIIWTGDNLPHVWNPNPGWHVIYEALNNITDLVRHTFPGAVIYPCIGNHDSFPPDILPASGDNSTYANYLEKGGWDKIIPSSSWPTFKMGGYYSAQIRQGLRLISLNTILWYVPNKLVEHMTDPANQFQWFEDELKNATSEMEQVYIIGHVPPGFYNKVILPHGKVSPMTYHQQFLEKYLEVTGKYYSTIAGQFFGHLHLDTFQLFQYDTGVTHSSSLLSSSVTPWHSGSLKGLSLPVNPSVRLLHYYQNNGSLADYDQYFLNLTKANKMAEEEPDYEHLYKFTEAYNVSDVSTASLYQVYEKLKSSDETFKLFNHYMTAGKDSETCGEHCKTAELCAIICTSLKEYIPCMQTSHADITGIGSHTTLYAVMGSLIVILVLVSVVAFFCIRKKDPHNPRQYQRFLDF